MTDVMENPYHRDKWPAHLTLEWLLREKLPIYVRNTTRPRGQLGVNFPNLHGSGMKTEKIPRTHLPVELTGKLSPETIGASNDLRAMLQKGVLDLVRPDLAWKELQDPENAAETDRLQLSAFSAKNAFLSRRVQDMQQTVDERVDPNSPIQPLGIETSEVTARILRFVEQLKTGDLSIKAAISELKTMEGELTDRDCSYIVANGPGGQIKSYVQKILASIQGRGISAYSVEDDGAPEMTASERAEDARRAAMATAQQGESPAAREAAIARNREDHG